MSCFVSENRYCRVIWDPSPFGRLLSAWKYLHYPPKSFFFDCIDKWRDESVKREVIECLMISLPTFLGPEWPNVNKFSAQHAFFLRRWANMYRSKKKIEWQVSFLSIFLWYFSFVIVAQKHLTTADWNEGGETSEEDVFRIEWTTYAAFKHDENLANVKESVDNRMLDDGINETWEKTFDIVWLPQ